MRFGGDDFDDDGRNNNDHHNHRVRQFSHVEGNYATSVKIRWRLTRREKRLVDDFVRELQLFFSSSSLSLSPDAILSRLSTLFISSILRFIVVGIVGDTASRFSEGISHLSGTLPMSLVVAHRRYLARGVLDLFSSSPQCRTQDPKYPKR